MGRAAGDRFFCMAQRLFWKALKPKDNAQNSVASHAVVATITRGFGAVALGIVKGEA
jgi:hypothetical protein